jgi:aryl-alcohol dehydrogenase-like predicted oxidoreductase
MELRPLGRTGVSISNLCLGAMMFGSWGNPDHDESIRIVHAALDAGINLVDTADVYGEGRVGGDRRQGARRRPPRRRRPRHQVPRTDG